MSLIQNSTNNAFARILLYYYLYMRSKLTDKDLKRIAAKYKGKDSVLLVDIFNKYGFPVPDFVSHTQLLMIVSTCGPIPKMYVNLMELSVQMPVYNKRLDVCSSHFNPETVLSTATILAPNLHAPLFDNMSKVCHLVPGHASYRPVSHTVEDIKAKQLADEALSSSSSSGSNSIVTAAVSKVDSTSSFGSLLSAYKPPPTAGSTVVPDSNAVAAVADAPAVPRSVHLFQTIALSATFKGSSGSSSNNSNNISSSSSGSGGATSLGGSPESPMQLLLNCMQRNIRVRVIVRRKGCVRGSIDAYVRAFDKHFNLLLVDADEEYIANQQSARGIALGVFTNRSNVARRHLTQLLVRGDSVVMVYRVPAGSRLSEPSSRTPGGGQRTAAAGEPAVVVK